MALTPTRFVTSGYYRIHLYVLLGINVFATFVASSSTSFKVWPPMLAAILSYVGSVIWLYEKTRPGILILYLIATVTWCGGAMANGTPHHLLLSDGVLWLGDLTTAGLILGFTLAAMFLGHWYLNTPTMDLIPLKRLVLFIFLAVFTRMMVCGLGLVFLLNDAATVPLRSSTMALLALRWLSGLIGTLVFAIMTWETLKIPNTQSATGILYVGVIVTFIGELTSQLLSTDLAHPV